MSEFSSNAARIFYIDAPANSPDKREPILLIHGFASSHSINWSFPGWIETLSADGRRTIALDNRGHGRSEKFYDPACYAAAEMAEDCLRLLDHLQIERADVMGYSMGARIGAHLASEHPHRIRSLVLGGLGDRLIHDAGLPQNLAGAMEAERIQDLADPQERQFREFAEATRSDRRALAACIRGNRQPLSLERAARLTTETLICVGGEDDIAGDPFKLAALLPNARVEIIERRDHNRTVGDKAYKRAVKEFLAQRP